MELLSKSYEICFLRVIINYGESCMYSKLEEIIHFVFKAFEGKKRIKEDIDLAFHSISVGFI